MRSMVMCGVLLATVASAAEQEPSPQAEARRTFVGLVPIQLRQSVVGIDGERVLNPKLSARLGMRFGVGVGRNSGTGGDIDSSRFQMGIEPGLRYYLTGTALDGLWLGGHLELSGQLLDNSSGSGLLTSNEDHSYRVGAATLMGYSMVVSRGLTIQAGVGLGAEYAWGQLNVNGVSLPDGAQTSSQFELRTWGISERVTLAVGWAF